MRKIFSNFYIFCAVIVFSIFLCGTAFALAGNQATYVNATDVVVMNLKAQFTNIGQLKLNWDTPTETDLDFYELIKSDIKSEPGASMTDGSAILLNSDTQTVPTIDGSLGYLDITPSSGISYYRLCVYTILQTRACGNTVSVYGSKKLILQPLVGPFTDIAGHWAETYIDKLRVLNVVQGNKGLFDPNRNILRSEAIKIIMLGYGIGGTSCHAEFFPDMGANDWFCDVVSKAKQLGYVQGDKGMLYPGREITRAEAVKIVLLVKGIEVPDITSAPFDDVPLDAWYAKYVAKAKELNIVGGVGNNKFEPNRSITRAELSKVVAVAVSL